MELALKMLWKNLFEKTKSKLLKEAILIFIDERKIDDFSGLIITTDEKLYKNFCINDLHIAIKRDQDLMYSFQTLLIYLCTNYADSKTLMTRNIEDNEVESYILITKLQCCKCKKYPALAILLFKDDHGAKSINFIIIPIENITNK